MSTDHPTTDPHTDGEEPVVLGPMSKHHVLHMARVAPTLPSHLFRPLLVLAIHADHLTGLSRPGRKAFETRWGIPYSSWHRQMQQLAKLGLIRQVVMGNKETGDAAEYQLLYAPALTCERTSSLLSEINPSPHRGGGATGEKGRGDIPLTDDENRLWEELARKVRERLTERENQRLTEQSLSFDMMTRLKRVVLRIAQEYGGEYEIVTALTERHQADRPAYDGVRNVLAAMWARARSVADRYGFDMADQTPIVVDPKTSPVDLGIAIAALDEVVPGLARTFERLGKYDSAAGR
jgi:hypothetical protein